MSAEFPSYSSSKIPELLMIPDELFLNFLTPKHLNLPKNSC